MSLFSRDRWPSVKNREEYHLRIEVVYVNLNDSFLCKKSERDRERKRERERENK
jgi:hypothetical protein